MNKNRLINHFKAMQFAAENFDVVLQLDVSSFVLTACSSDGEDVKFYPQFLEFTELRRRYITTIEDTAQIFIGWRPYEPVVIPTFSDKLALKHFFIEQGIVTPAFSLSGYDDLGAVVIKNKSSSFGRGVFGPFKLTENHPFDVRTQYYEQFIEGDLVKLWFWNDTLVCLEQLPMPTIVGDGHKTIEVLLRERVRSRWVKRLDWDEVLPVLRYFNRSLEDVLPYGEKQVVDIRYASLVADIGHTEVKLNVHDQLFSTYPALENLGKQLYSLIEPVQPHLAYSVDAIRSADNQLWMLEANSNPFIHPHLYFDMLSTLFCEAEEAYERV